MPLSVALRSLLLNYHTSARSYSSPLIRRLSLKSHSLIRTLFTPHSLARYRSFSRSSGLLFHLLRIGPGHSSHPVFLCSRQLYDVPIVGMEVVCVEVGGVFD